MDSHESREEREAALEKAEVERELDLDQKKIKRATEGRDAPARSYWVSAIALVVALIIAVIVWRTLI
ncbi:MAG TPA: hypothetical protein VFY39_08560 [Gammaproteobacteria bacterium]|nr:hypothetical protein [Gammaproteobacteria bacterium]